MIKNTPIGSTGKTQRHLTIAMLLFVVGLMAQAILNLTISDYLTKLDQKVRNAEIENVISHEIILEIHKVETSFFALTAFPNRHYRKILINEIQEIEHELVRALEILNEGGDYHSHIDLNLPNTEEQYETLRYEPDFRNRFSFAQADIVPKIKIINEKLVNLQKIIERINHYQTEDIEKLPEEIESLKLQVKLFYPIFDRLKEDANQIVYQNRINFMKLRSEVESNKQFFKYVQILLTFTILLLVAMAMLSLFRNIRSNAQELEKSKDYAQELLNSQSNIIIVNDGQQITDASGGFFTLFDEYEDVKAFSKDHQCICDLFVKEKGFIDKHTGNNWIEYILRHPEKMHKAKVRYKGVNRIYQIQVIKSPVYHRFIISMFEITELELIHNELEKERNKALASTKSKGEFLANMSHEIRTPLNAILGFIDLLRDKKHDTETTKYLETINNSSQALLGIINDILDLSKIESGKLTIVPEQFHTEKEFQNIADLFRARCSEKHLNFKLLAKDDVPNVLVSDILRIKQIISNLLSNAIKFTEPNKNIELDISFKEERLFIAVRDEGIGLSEEAKMKIFEAFTQAESSTTRKYGGTGLGLTISSQLVQMLGGQLRVDSEIGKGSSFYFDIPVEVPDIEENQLSNDDTVFDPNAQYSGHILLVEDNKTNQLLMKAILKKIGITYDLAEDGVEAVDYYHQHQYDLILMDENMPNMNGIRATEIIRAHEFKNKVERTVIVALTANAMVGDRERFLEAGLDDYLTKPINLNELHRVMHTYLNRDKNGFLTQPLG